MCESCDFERWLGVLDDLLEDEDYDWADDTLEGIRGWVDTNKHITDRQMGAIENIQKAVSNRERR